MKARRIDTSFYIPKQEKVRLTSSPVTKAESLMFPLSKGQAAWRLSPPPYQWPCKEKVKFICLRDKAAYVRANNDILHFWIEAAIKRKGLKQKDYGTLKYSDKA